MVTAEVHLIVVVCHATRPDEGLIVEGAGGGVNHGVVSLVKLYHGSEIL